MWNRPVVFSCTAHWWGSLQVSVRQGFIFLLKAMQHVAVGIGMGYYPPPAGTEPAAAPFHPPDCWWAVLLVPAIGGLLCGWLVYGYAPEAEGHGTDGMVRSFHRHRGRIRARVPLVKSVASVLTIGTGGSAGREGPIAQIGAGFGSLLAGRLQLGEGDRRQLMLAGAAGGIGAIFHAPLGGALFVTEVLYGTTALEFAAVIPCVISSITAFIVFTAIYGHSLAIVPPHKLAFSNLGEIPFYIVFALICALVGYVYVRVFYGLRDRFFRPLAPAQLDQTGTRRSDARCGRHLATADHGRRLWLDSAGNRRQTHRWSCSSRSAWPRSLATSLTISSGGSGGVFAPSLFIGAMLGGAFAGLCTRLLPGVIQQPEAFVLVGMGGFFAGVAKVPLTAVLMVSEMTSSYGLLVPLMLVSIINVAVLSSRWTLYEEQVPTIVDSPAHQGDFIVDVLEQIRVRGCCRHEP